MLIKANWEESMDKIIKQLARELNIREKQVASTIALLDEGNTIPFIARYRKEVTEDLLTSSFGPFLRGSHT